MKKRIFELLLIVTASFCIICVGNFAYSAEPDYKGYIVSAELDPYSVNLADDDGICVRQIAENENLYLAENEEELEYLKQIADINYIEPNYIVELADVDFSADYSNNIYSSDLWNYKMINADITLKNGYHGDNVRVGVVDSGINTEHIDFFGTIDKGHNYTADNDDVGDNLGHGSFVSGIIAARLNGMGMVGIAPEAEIIPLKAFEGKTTVVSYVIQAIYGGVDEFNCDVLNLSLELSVNLKSLQSAVNYAAEKGVICVAAAGNITNSYPENTIRYPAGYGTTIGVGSVTKNGEVYSTSVKNSSVDVVAPGVNISSLDYTGNAKFKSGTGTSYAAPHVTALAAILKSVDKNIDIERFLKIIKNTSTDIYDEGYDVDSGYGIVNVAAAVEYMLSDQAVYQNKMYAKADGYILFTNLNLIYREEENANLIYALKDSGGVIKDIKIYDASNSEFTNYEYSIDAEKLSDGDYVLEVYLFGNDSSSPLYEKRVLEFSK